MVKFLSKRKSSAAKEVAYIALTCALLIGGQYALSFVYGIEIVTVILMGFSFTFGVRSGTLCAVAFSLLRCFIFGFFPTVILLYLIYYPLLCALFGQLGKCKSFSSAPCALVANAILLSLFIGALTLYFTNAVKVSISYASALKIALLLIACLSLSLCVAYDFLYFKRTVLSRERYLKIILIASVGAAATTLFNLLDDVITPLFWGYSHITTLAYFYSSFTAMLPQIICTIVCACTLFEPITSAMKKFG